MNRQERRAWRIQILKQAAIPSITQLVKNIEMLPEASDQERARIQKDFDSFWEGINDSYRKLRNDVHVNLGKFLEDLGQEITDKTKQVIESIPEPPAEGEEPEGAPPASTIVETMQIKQHADRIERLMRTIVDKANEIIRSLK